MPNVTLVTVERASTITALDEPTLTAQVDVQIAGRLDLATVNEAYRMVGDGEADPPTVDACLQARGWAAGPFGIAGAVGLRALVDGPRELAVTDDPPVRDRFLVAPLLWQMATI